MRIVIVDTDVASFLFKEDTRAELYKPHLEGDVLAAITGDQKMKMEDRNTAERDTAERPDAAQMLHLVLEELRELKERQAAFEALVKDRFLDTRPLWQEIGARTERIEAQLETTNERITGVEKELRTLNRKIEVFNEEMLTIKANIKEHTELLERRPN